MDGNQIAETVIVAFCAVLLLLYFLHYFYFGKFGPIKGHTSLWNVGVQSRKEWAVAMIASAEKGTSGRVPAKVAVRSAVGLLAKVTRCFHAHCLQIQRKT